MNRREFLSVAGAALAGAPVLGKGTSVPNPTATPAANADYPRPPVLQAPSETGITIAWAVNELSTGAVEIAENATLTGARLVKAGEMPLAEVDDQSLRVTLEGLKPATRYWYRTLTTRIFSERNPNASRIKRGETKTGAIHSFVTPGTAAESRFVVMNDTHCIWESFAFTAARMKALRAPVCIWNGDALNCTEKKETAVEAFLAPRISTHDYASETPILFINGNHEFGGQYARHVCDVMAARPESEREARYRLLKRNFALRQGALALIGLDTGEGLHDDDLRLAGLASFAPYRTLQAAWLEEQLSRPEIAAAPFVIAFCHIPLHNTGENPFGGEEPRARGCASWLRACRDAWGPVLEKHHVQLVITGHEHLYRWDDKIPGFSWSQVVGGGPELGYGAGGVPSDKHFPTVIEGAVEQGQLVVRVWNSWRNRLVSTRTFPPRPSI